ncbi:MAG: DUF1501 domain-containing protein [Verrucomicrobiaceae bacterium]|nr:DUF1501 domain-containing protein [Verrucomicrobiaceae bacterium]
MHLPTLCHRQHHALVSRRDFLRHTGAGFGAAALSTLVADEAHGATAPHHPPRAKAVIQLFMLGGASQCDTFDYKAALQKRSGEKVAFKVTGGTVSSPGPVLGSPWEWKRHGQCGRWVSSALPHLAGCVDDMAFLMAMHAPTSEHSAGMTMQVSGFLTPGFPTVGAWVDYAMGNESRELPAYVALPDPVGLPWSGKSAWTNGFLPSMHQGTMLKPSSDNPVPDLFAPKSAAFATGDAQRNGLALLRRINQRHHQSAPDDSRLEARIASYELAARLQLAVPKVLDIQGESAATRKLYGLDDSLTEPIGKNCLIARRLVERGVRFVQLWVGSGLNGAAGNWDNHGDVTPGSDFQKMCVRSDKPIAGLLHDLKSHGLLDETLVIWTTEFGRTPYSQGSKGRDHNGNTFVSWMAGGGVKGGASYGESDEFSYAAAVNDTMCYDQHATMLHLLGYNHEKLTFRHNGVDRRLTDVHGKVVHELLA